jgi:type 2 lantibiotic biosynthesis protein LanM
MEFVQTEACNSLEQIQRFFERQGAYLAILYLLGATDIHRENLIASGEHPVVVDLETLFHPRLSVAQTSEDPNIQACIEALSDSVLQTGLLPVPLTIDREIDLSGICGSPDQVTPYKVLQWRAAASDEWSYVRDHTQLGESEHSPCIKGEEIQVQDYTPFIVSGFAVVYRKFLQYQDTLLEEIGPLTPFAKDTIRVVVRATQVYGVLLQESYHPDVLRDGIARDQLFDQLWAPCAWGQSFSKVVTAEQQDLWNNDIPIFTSSPLSKDLWTSRGERIENFLPEASMRSVMRRLTSLGESDLAKQCWIIETALWSNVTQSRLDGSIASETEPSIFAMANEWHPRKDEVLIDTAVQLGKRLMKLAIRSQDSTTWLTLAIGNSSQWRIVPCGIDLYSGVSGISLFLAYLTAVTGDSCYRELAQLAVQPLLKKNETFEQSFSGIGLFTGLGGVIYTLTHLSVLWNEERLLEKAVQYASQVEQLVDGDQDFDLIDGAAGCIMGLLPLYRITNSPRILDLLIHCGERLVSSAIPQACGVGWLIRLEPSHALSGISHGVAGIALALLELWAITNIDKMKDTAIRALEYERSLFSPAYGNWPDLRRNREDLIHQSRSKFMDSWCHGAPGIGMARIGIFERCPSEEVRQEIEVAIGTTLREGFGGNHCLCHGDLGNIDLLLLARDRLGMNELNGRIDLLSMVLTRSLRKGIACGVPIRAQPTGLMLGIAGIGFGLLRLNNSKSVPSVLLAEPPIV